LIFAQSEGTIRSHAGTRAVTPICRAFCIALTLFGSAGIAKADLAASVLPASRSVQIGVSATAFATIINAGSATATACKLTPTTPVAATFTYQTTDPATNHVTGTANTPVDIAAGAAQSFVFAITPIGPFIAADVPIKAACANAVAPTVVGLNTLLFSASAAPVADIVALGATVSGDGILNIP